MCGKCDEKCSECSCSVIAEDCCPYDEDKAREKNVAKITLVDLVKVFDLKTVDKVVVREEGVAPIEFTESEFETHWMPYAFKTVEKFSVRTFFNPTLDPNVLILSLKLKD